MALLGCHFSYNVAFLTPWHVIFKVIFRTTNLLIYKVKITSFKGLTNQLCKYIEEYWQGHIVHFQTLLIYSWIPPNVITTYCWEQSVCFSYDLSITKVFSRNYRIKRVHCEIGIEFIKEKLKGQSEFSRTITVEGQRKKCAHEFLVCYPIILKRRISRIYN